MQTQLHVAPEYADDAGKHLPTRTYADFSEELIRQSDNKTTCPFFMDRNDLPKDSNGPGVG